MTNTYFTAGPVFEKYGQQLSFTDADPSFDQTQVGWVAPGGPKAGENVYMWHPGGISAARLFVAGLRDHGIVSWVV